MYVCSLDQSGGVLVPRHMQTPPEACLHAMAPYRQGRGGAVACLCTWDGLAERCAAAGSPCVLGPALSLQAIQGGQAPNDTIDSPQIAARLRGGMLPHASGSPAQRRATRDRLRRRLHRAHTRAELLAHVPHTNSPSHLPASGPKIASQANREGVAERWADPAVHQRSAVDLARITSDEAWLRAGERTSVTTARPPDAPTLARLPTVPGIGPRLRLVLLDAMQQIDRFPRGQAVVSSCRLGHGAKASAGTRRGTSGTKIGNAQLQWAFAEAAVVCLSDPPAAQPDRARVETNPAPGTAWTRRAQPWARAVSSMLKRHVAFERETFFERAGRGAAEPGASRDPQGMHLHKAFDTAPCRASVHAKTPLGHPTLRPALGGDIRARSCLTRRSSPTAGGCGSAPEPGAHGTMRRVEPALCRGR